MKLTLYWANLFLIAEKTWGSMRADKVLSTQPQRDYPSSQAWRLSFFFSLNWRAMFWKNKSVLVTPVDTPSAMSDVQDKYSADAPERINIVAENLIWHVAVAVGAYKVLSTVCSAAEHVVVTKVN